MKIKYLFTSLFILCLFAPLLCAQEGKTHKRFTSTSKQSTDINIRDKSGETLLHYAVQYGRLELAKYLVDKGADINTQDIMGETPLHYAAQYGRLEIAKYLVEKGANINARTKYKGTPLHFAVQKGEMAMVKYLVESGADINARNGDGYTPLDLSMRTRNDDITAYLKDKRNEKVEEYIINSLNKSKERPQPEINL